MKLADFKKLKVFVAHKSFLKLVFLGLVLMIIFKNLTSVNQQNRIKQAILPVVMNITATSYTPSVKVSGFLRPEKMCAVKANFKAVVSKVYIKKGRDVKKGDLILELKSDEINILSMKHIKSLLKNHLPPITII